MLRVALPVALALPIAAAAFGGWATITVEDLPDQVTARQPVTLIFTVRQHGREPLDGLRPRIEARAGGRAAEAAALPARARGKYIATLTLPQPGQWTITIHSGFGNSRLTLAPLAVVAPGTTAATPAPAERGARLFVAKGCVTCHLHRSVPGSGEAEVGPELTGVGQRLAADYLRRFLADPSIKPPAPGRSFGMPNLGLKEAEIAALTAFLTTERQASR
jgi:mono/diheme cytochrome c family protein